MFWNKMCELRLLTDQLECAFIIHCYWLGEITFNLLLEKNTKVQQQDNNISSEII